MIDQLGELGYFSPFARFLDHDSQIGLSVPQSTARTVRVTMKECKPSITQGDAALCRKVV